MSYAIQSNVNGVFGNLNNLHSLRPVVTQRVFFESFFGKTTWGVATGLNYTTRNGQSATAAPRNNQAEWKHVRNQSATATSAATTTSIGKSLTGGPAYHWAWGSGGTVRSQGSSVTNLDRHRCHVFVSKGSSDLDDVLDELLADTDKGVGQVVIIGCPANGAQTFLSKAVTTSMAACVVATLYDDVVDGGNYWDLPISISNQDGQVVSSGQFCNGGIKATTSSNPDTNTNSGIMYPYAADAAGNGTTTSVNFFPNNNTYIAVSKLGTWATPNPDPLSENQLHLHPYKFSSNTARNAESFAWENGQLVINTTTPTLYEFTGTSLTSAATTSNSQWTEVTENKNNSMTSFLAFPDGYDGANTDIVTDTQIDPVGYFSNPFNTPSGGNIIRYGDYGRIDMDVIQTSFGYIVSIPELYGTNGVYPAPTGQTIQVNSVDNGSRQAVWKTKALHQEPDNENQNGKLYSFNSVDYIAPDVTDPFVIDSNSGFLGKGVNLSGVVYMVSRS